jgi:glutathione-regulated potassium-efflux system ancillary protein KefG
MKNLMLMFHPNINESFAHRHIKEALQGNSKLTLRDQYALYPNGLIDVQQEQDLLMSHDRIIMQFPFRWFGAPPLFKEWETQVLSYGFAYGASGDKLKNKKFLIALTTGGPKENYLLVPNERYQFNIRTLLSPLEQTALFCGMVFEDPIVCYGMNINPAQGIQQSHQQAVDEHIHQLNKVMCDL